MNWQDDIVKFNLPHAKILYMIYFFFRNGQLNFQQKHKLKEYVILENQKIFEKFGEFERSKNENKLLNDIKDIYNEEIKYSLQEVNPPAGGAENTEQDQSTNKSGTKNTIVRRLSIDTKRSILHNAYVKVNVNKPNQDSEKEAIEEITSPHGNALRNKKRRQQNDKHKK